MPPAQTKLGQRSLDPRQGFGFHQEPRPQYLQALDTVVEGVKEAPTIAMRILDDPRNMWLGVGMPWLYHGTAATRAGKILREGFDPRKIGENWGHAFGPFKGRSGPGVYFSEAPIFAKSWADMAGEPPAIVRAFIPEKSIKTYPSGGSVVDRANRVKEAQQLGFSAVRFPDEVVVPAPERIPLKNIRLFTGNPRESLERFDRLLSYMKGE